MVRIEQAPDMLGLLKEASTNPVRAQEVMARLGEISFQDEYKHWNKVKHLPTPHGLSHREWWLLLKMGRTSTLRQLPYGNEQGHPFAVGKPDVLLRLFHEIDSRATARTTSAPEELTGSARDTYVIRMMMEEGIHSSQLEGAATTRKAAKEMLRSGREPSSKDERMIANNYRAMQFILDHQEEDLTLELLLELHRTITSGTLDDPEDEGRIQTPSDVRVQVVDLANQEVLHKPPTAELLTDRLSGMFAFANQRDSDSKFWLHPISRSIVLHHWLAYDHPFVDGNGRTARAIYYWSLLRHGYWLTQFIPISRTIQRAHGQYLRSFQYVTKDFNDVTYFVASQAEMLLRALKDLDEYLESKALRHRKIQETLLNSGEFNHRQLAIIKRALSDPAVTFTAKSHMNSHRISRATALTDLDDLAKRGVLGKRKRSNKHLYRPLPAFLVQHKA